METQPDRTIRLGVIQAAPVFLDRDATAARACALIEEAGSARIDVLGFPEGYIPTHPDWYHYVPASSAESFGFAKRMFLNAVEVPSATTDRLCAAAANSHVNVVIGICERTPEPDLTLYNSQLFISSEGQILGRHRKIMPTLAERVVHARGGGDGLRVFVTPAARVSGLICGENSNPLAITALAAERPAVHVASWPSPVSKDEGGMDELICGASQSLAYQLGAFVLSSHAVVSEAIATELGQTDDDREFLTRQVGRGSSMIVAPDRSILARAPNEPWEGIVTADVDLDATVVARHIHDFVGHYNRSDIFSLQVDRRTGPLVRMIDDADVTRPSPPIWSTIAAEPPDEPDGTVAARVQADRESTSFALRDRGGNASRSSGRDDGDE
jgi:aliphatic nitrilase